MNDAVDIGQWDGNPDDSFLTRSGLVESAIQHIVADGGAKTNRAARSCAHGFDDFRAMGVIFHLFRYFGGIADHPAVARDHCDPRTELAGKLTADVVESEPCHVKGYYAGKQVRFPLHSLAQRLDVKVSQQGVRRKIEAQEEQRDDGEVGKKNFCDETTVPKPFHRIYSRHLGE